MRTLIVLAWALCLALFVNQTRADEPASVETNAQAETTSANASKKEDTSWRYKRHNGQWWYWMPNEYWVYHEGGRWIVYDAQTYRRPRTSTYSYSGGNTYRGSRGYSYQGGGRLGGAFRHVDASDAVDFAEDVATTIFTFSW